MILWCRFSTGTDSCRLATGTTPFAFVEKMKVGKFWSLLFGVTMLACLGLFLVAPFIKDANGTPLWWLQGAGASHDDSIDFLYYVIFGITGFFFVLTEGLLVYFMFRYAAQSDGKPPQPKPSMFAGLLKPVASVLNEPHKIELAWTIVPAAILLYIAFAQVGTWDKDQVPVAFPGFRGKERQEGSPSSARSAPVSSSGASAIPATNA